MRIILVVGNGGVGKTTVAAATALQIAARGAPVLVVSTDAAHSLGDVLATPLTSQPSHITHNVEALHLDGCHELTHSFATIRSYVQRLLGRTDLELPLDELLIVPGLDELLALTRLRSLAAQGRCQTIVVDCAATAESLRLLSLPDVVGWYVERLFGRDALITNLMRRHVQRTLSVPLPSREVLSAVGELGDDLQRLRATLGSTATTARIVLTPERVVVAEARRALSYLSLYGFAVDAVIINRVLPPELDGGFFDQWRARQEQSLVEIEASFDSLPILRAPLSAEEPVGVDLLSNFAARLFGELDPAARLAHGRAIALDAAQERAVVRVPVAGFTKGEVQLHRADDELIVTLGSQRRILRLPDSLRELDIARASLTNEDLEITFGPRGHVS